MESSSSSSTVINIKINDNDEIELIKTEEENPDYDEGGPYEEYEVEDVDDDAVLVPKSDGVMTIKKKKKTLDHMCYKCEKTYKTPGGLKRHINLCRNLPINESATDDKLSVDDVVTDLTNLNDDTCFCCLEKKETAHAGHIKCNFCPKAFKTHLNLERHLFSLHSAKSDFPCDSCNATCPNKLLLELHKESHVVGKPFSCTGCGKDFTRKYHLDRHLKFANCDKSKPKKVLTCDVCKKEFTRVDNLREHLRQHLGMPGRRKDFHCPQCDKRFYGSSLLNIHIRTHTGERPFPCDLCEKSFPSNGALRKHRRMHTGERPYSCELCGKCFSAKETLNRHVKIHTGQKPHTCKVCDKSFIQATQLKSHMFYHNNENGFSCEDCKIVFNRRSRLFVHIASIHGKKHECKVCGKFFEKNEDLKNHLNVDHEGPKKFECTFCDKKFATKASANTHQKSHQNPDPCVCKICKRVFKRLDCLMRHMHNRHTEYLTSIIAEKTNETPTMENDYFHEKSNDDIVEEYEIVEDVNEDPLDEQPAAAATSTVASGSKIEQYSIEPIELMDFKLESINHEYESEEEQEPQQQQQLVTLKLPQSLNRKRIKEEDQEDEITIETTLPTRTQKKKQQKQIMMTEKQLIKNISSLLDLLVDADTLSRFGWPNVDCNDVLTKVIEQCGQIPADDYSCSDLSTKLRENCKLLFTSAIEIDSIKELLNNHTVDEVILHVLNLNDV